MCSRFSLKSYHAESKTAFEAAIRFPAYTRQEIDKVVAEAESSGVKYVQNGQYFVNEIDYIDGQSGLRISTTYLRETFRKTMSSLESLGYLQFNQRKQSYPDFDSFLSAITHPELSALYFASAYDQLIFGLALASPLPYPEANEAGEGLETVLLKVPQLKAIHDKLKSFKFRVEIDNMAICRPLLLPSNKIRTLASDCKLPARPEKKVFELKDGVHVESVPIEIYEIKVGGHAEKFFVYLFDYKCRLNGLPFHFSGYIFMQTTRLFPKEFQGVLVRLRHVAIGQYDVNVMTYPQAEGPRFSMLSAEVFVHQGLDDALKVDRDGFNTLDPHYIRLQAFMHSILHEEIFPGSWGEEKERNKNKREIKQREKNKRFSARISATTNQRITKVEIVKTKSTPNSKLVSINRNEGSITINESHPDAKAVLGKRKFRGIAAQVVSAFEIANRETSPEKRREVFYKLIEDVFND